MSDITSMTTVYTRSVDIRNPIHTWRDYSSKFADPASMNTEANSARKIEMGGRLRAIREVHGLSQAAMGEIMGIVTTGISAWETGRTTIDLIALTRAAERLGFTIDYVALGDMSGLRFDVALKLQEYLRNVAPGNAGKRGRRPKIIDHEPIVANQPPRLRDIKEPTHVAPRALQSPNQPFIHKP